MIGEQHQRAADQIRRMRMVERPGPHDLLVQRRRRFGARSQHRRDDQPQDLRARHRAAFRRALLKARGSASVASDSTAMARSIGGARSRGSERSRASRAR